MKVVNGVYEFRNDDRKFCQGGLIVHAMVLFQAFERETNILSEWIRHEPRVNYPLKTGYGLSIGLLYSLEFRRNPEEN